MLGDAASGGTWSSPLSSAGIATINSTTGAVSGISLGTTAVTYSLGGTCTAYKTVTVNPLPPKSITGSLTVCTSSLINLYRRHQRRHLEQQQYCHSDNRYLFRNSFGCNARNGGYNLYFSCRMHCYTAYYHYSRPAAHRRHYACMHGTDYDPY